MKKIFTYLLVTISLIGFSSQLFAQMPFNKGVNLSKWYEENAIRDVQFSKYTKESFQEIKSLGFDVIRLPINLMYFTDATTHKIDPLLFDVLDHPVAWAEEVGIHIILDNHTLFDNAEKRYVDSSKNFDVEKYKQALIYIWEQMAEYYKDRSDLIVYEIQNEPNNPMTTQVWGKIQQDVITAIRQIDTKHYLIVGGAKSNSLDEMLNLPNYSDSKLIYTYHFYEPMVFTHQGSAWVKPSSTSSLAALSGIPFPYDAETMPQVPASLEDTWVKGNMEYTYPNQTGNAAYLAKEVKKASDFAIARNANIFCGEMGVYDKSASTEDKNFWTKTMRDELEKEGLAWAVWEYKSGNGKDGFGLFTKNTNELFNHDLNVSLLESLGLSVPTQSPFVPLPEKETFIIYDDYPAANIQNTSGRGGGTIDFYHAEQVGSDKYAILWTGSNRYAQVGFTFTPIKDMTWLRDNDYQVKFDIKASIDDNEIEEVDLDVRFLDKNGVRFKRMIDKNLIKWNSDSWQTIAIPIKDFYLAMSNVEFDWEEVLELEFVNEYSDLKGRSVWIDNVAIVDKNFSSIDSDKTEDLPLSIYPNPLANHSVIRYSLSKEENVDISIFSITGQKLLTVKNELQTEGTHMLYWQDITSGAKLSEGIYLCQLRTNTQNKTIKLIIQ